MTYLISILICEQKSTYVDITCKLLLLTRHCHTDTEKSLNIAKHSHNIQTKIRNRVGGAMAGPPNSKKEVFFL